MTLKEFIEVSKHKLSGIYDERESRNILNLIIEKEFGTKAAREMRVDPLSEINAHMLIDLERILLRLEAGEPVQYILEEVEFLDLKLKVDTSVLIPRPETEELVQLAARSMDPNRSIKILDVGTGSGCIAIALKSMLPGSEIVAIDKEAGAVDTAKGNAESNGFQVRVIKMDFLDESQWDLLEAIEMIVSNPPYITRDEYADLDEKVKGHEPDTALISEEDDPFIFYRKIVKFALTQMKLPGSIYVELNNLHALSIKKIFEVEGISNIEVHKDLQGNDRILSCDLKVI